MLSLSICGVHSMAYLDQGGEKFDGFRDLSWHGNVHILFFVIIVNGKSIAVLLFNYHEGFVIFFKSFTEMIIVGTVKSFDTKIINTYFFSSLYYSRGLYIVCK